MSLFENCQKLLRYFSLLKMPFYAVRRGKHPGVYKTWPECKAQVDGFKTARYKKFETEAEALDFVNDKTPEKPFGHGSSSPVSCKTPSASVFAPSLNTADTLVLPPTTGPTRISSTRLLALKGTLNNMKLLSEQLRQYVTQAEEQIEAISKGKKRTATEASASAVNAISLPTSSSAPASLDVESPMKKPRNGSASRIQVYTDGCCHSNGKDNCRAGIGVYWGPDHPMNVSERLSGRQTNNRAEILAACTAIRQARKVGYSELEIFTDSQFLINGITKWILKWKKNGWKLSTGGNVVNKADFEELDGLLQDGLIKVTWTHVDGHSGIPGNEAADQLANAGARK